MKHLITLVITIFSFAAFSQNMKIEGITKVDSVSRDELYLRARNWFLSSFVSPKQVIQIDDSYNATIIGVGTFSYKPNWIEHSFSAGGHVQFTMKFVCKDGRYKIEIFDFRHVAFNLNGHGKSFGKITNSMVCPEHLQSLNRENNDNIWMDIKEKISLEVNDLAKSIRMGMLIPTVPDGDW
jgi:hypothetical protein